MLKVTRPSGGSPVDGRSDLNQAELQIDMSGYRSEADQRPFRFQSTAMATDILRIGDIAIVIVTALFADGLFHALRGSSPPSYYYAAVLVAALLTPWLFSQSKAYVAPKGRHEERWMQTAVVSLTKLTLLLGLLFMVVQPNSAEARDRYMLWVICLSGSVLMSRWTVKQVLRDSPRKRGVGTTVAIIGANATAQKLLAELSASSSSHYPIELLGVFDDRVAARDADPGLRIAGSIEDLIARCLETPVHHIVLAIPPFAQSRLSMIVDRLKALSIEVTVCPEFVSEATPVQGSALGSLLLIPLARPPLSGWDRACKRALDWSLSFVVLIFLAPILIVICVAIRLDSPGPILFRQTRNGLNGRQFVIYKFRSMFVEGADPMGARQTEVNDQRITRVGRILRASSLDELPQLFNVLEGTMSLVGPRPHPVGMRTEAMLCEEISPHYSHRHQVKPGITGWAQVHGCRGATRTMDDLLKRVAFDIDYVEHWSVFLDLRILVLTPALLFLGERPKTMASSAPNRIAALALVCLASILSAHGGSAATYYVSSMTGQDAANGSSAQPWRSIQRALSALMAGDRVIVRAGRYAGPVVVAASGAPNHLIEIIGEGRPLVEAHEDAISLTGDYLLLEGFEAHSSGWGSAIAVGKNNHHIRILDNIARDSACGGISAVQTDYLTIENNRVFGNARRAPWQCSGISIYEAVAQDGAQGVHNIIRRNIVYDNMNIFVDEAVSHSRGKTTDGNGIIVDDNDHSQNNSVGAPYDGATLIQDNTVFDNGGRGIHVFRSSNVIIVNNIAYHNLKDSNLQGPAAELSASFSRGVGVFDNIAVGRPGAVGLMDADDLGKNLWDYNLIVADRTLSSPHSNISWGRHNIVGRDPQFVRPELNSTADFRLARTSPGIGEGAAIRLGQSASATIVPGARADVGLTTP